MSQMREKILRESEISLLAILCDECVNRAGGSGPASPANAGPIISINNMVKVVTIPAVVLL